MRRTASENTATAHSFIFSCNSVLIAITVLPIKVIEINTNSRQNALRIKIEEMNMKRNGCRVTITMESYTDIDKIKRTLVPFSKFRQEWISATADTPLTAVLTTDDIYETRMRDELYGPTYTFSVVFDLLVSALSLHYGVIDMTMDYLTTLGNPGHCSFEFSRHPVPKGEKSSKRWLQKEEEARRQIAAEQTEERDVTKSLKDFCRVQSPDVTRIEITLNAADDAVVNSAADAVYTVMPSMQLDNNLVHGNSRLLQFSSTDLGLVARTNGAKSWSNMHYMQPFSELYDKLKLLPEITSLKMTYKTAMGVSTEINTEREVK